MRLCSFSVLVVGFSVFGLSVGAAEDAVPTVEGIEFFEKKIRPLLVQRCYSCHSRSAKTVQGGLKLDSVRDLRTGGDSGAVIVPGKPDASLLIPGVGAQGGDLARSLKAGNHSGIGLINVSRDISFRGDMSEEVIHKAALGYVEKMREVMS